MKISEHHFPYLPGRIARLEDLAYNLWFSWQSQATWLFDALDPTLRENVSRNPIRLLHEIEAGRLDQLAKDPEFLKKYDATVEKFDTYMRDKNTWFNQKYPEHSGKKIAYFSMEFGIHESLPIYSGGLGILAGDHLKSASDLGIPVIGIGLLYRESYFTQFISLNGHQQSLYKHNDFSDMPLSPVTDSEGETLTFKIPINDHELSVRVWKARVGRVPLFLMDTDFIENKEAHRRITERLYVSDRDSRLIQEMILGIGGVQLLHLLGIEPDVYHLNEGHCSLLIIERMCQYLKQNMDKKKAGDEVTKRTVFTTHTPIAAGNEVFERDRVKHHMHHYIQALNMNEEEFMALGRTPQHPDFNAFNMTILALQHSIKANAVSQLHGTVSRKMWQNVWPEKAEEDIPIGAITNGVHMHTWMTSQFKRFFDAHLGFEWREKIWDKDFWKVLESIPDEELWKVHRELKQELRKEVRCRLNAQRDRNGEPQDSINEASHLLHDNVLTIGFARRFAQYKRGTLLLRDRERLKRILTNSERPVQLIFAGKAHPADQPGKALIQEIYQESRNPEFQNRLVFVEDYDMYLARRLVSGVDVWLNPPRRPLEASGTSGMKAGANGAINLSVLDGWWRECYNCENGWAIGEDREYYNEWEQDESDSNSLYWLLENKVVPLFYEKDESGLPAKWIAMMKKSMMTVIPQFNTHRMLKEYVEQLYLPALKA